MKTKLNTLILTFVLLLVTTCMLGQNNLTVSVAQDVALAFWENDNGIEPFTTDVNIKVRVNGYQRDTGYFTLGGHYEYANLSDDWYGDFYRYGFEGGYTFNNLNLFNLFSYEITPIIGIGGIDRAKAENNGCWTMNVGTEFTVPISSWLNIYGDTYIQWRGDLPDEEFQPQAKLGFQYKSNKF